MTKEQYKNDEVIRIQHFYNLFVSRNRLYPTSYFLFATNTKKKHLPLEKSLFKKIILTYLNIYFNEFYYEDKPKYFMLSGQLEKAKGSPIIINSKKGIFRESKSICWVWSLRPSIAFVSNLKLIKLKGSNGRVGKLEKIYCKNKDFDPLSPINKVMARIIKHKKLFKDD